MINFAAPFEFSKLSLKDIYYHNTVIPVCGKPIKLLKVLIPNIAILRMP